MSVRTLARIVSGMVAGLVALAVWVMAVVPLSLFPTLWCGQ
jgi:hypothetical protein